MAKQLSFSFEKPYDEIEINKETYKLYFDDDSIKKYRKQATKYQEEVKSYLEKKKEVEDLNDEEHDQLEQEGMEFAKDFIETFFGEGSFVKLYGASGNSMLSFMPLIEYIFEWLSSKMPDAGNKKKEYYTKKVKN